jgi:hypothetical protein
LGCTFCREALADLAEKREALEKSGTKLCLVHMMPEDDERAASFFGNYGLEDVARVSDPDRRLYRAFGLRRGRVLQLFGWPVWIRGFKAGILNRHGVGGLAGDGLQMPGVFLLTGGEIARSFRHETAADRPDYEDLACCPAPSAKA